MRMHIYSTILRIFWSHDPTSEIQENLLLFICWIDDIFGIWIEDPDKPDTWEHFKQDLNDASKLELKNIVLETAVDFLDLPVDRLLNLNYLIYASYWIKNDIFWQLV